MWNPKQQVIHLQRGRLSGDTSPDDVDAIIDAFEASESPSGMAIHFHGGLTSKNKALKQIAQRLTPQYAEAGAFPVFFVWESAEHEAFRDKLWAISRESFFQRLVQRVSEFALKQLGGIAPESQRARGESPEGPTAEDVHCQVNAWLNQESEGIPPFEVFSDALDCGRPAPPDIGELEEAIHYQLADDSHLRASLTEMAAAAAETRGAANGGPLTTHMTPDGIEQVLGPDEQGT